MEYKLTNEPYDYLSDDIVTEKKIITEYVSDGIGTDYLNWKSQNPVLISAQTGMGKNTFIENVLIKHCIEQEKKILIISNRVVNNRQQKKRVASLVGCEKYLRKYSPEGLDEHEEFDNVRIVTYQKLEAYLYNLLESIKLQKFNIVIFDETHYFISDSLFNSSTGKILYKCLSTFKKSIRIYMTATPDEIFPIIIAREKKLGLSYSDIIYYSNDPIKAVLYPKKVLYYNFKRNYNYICPKYFSNKEELLELIKNDNSDSKWLIFVTSKEDGEEFVNHIGKNSTFITAESKDSIEEDGDAYSEIVRKEKFTCKVLICTSVMDNGINLKDKLLRNVVIFAYDKTEFVQMLGRKRITNQEKVNLFLYSRKPSDFNTKLFTIKKQIQAICLFKNDPSMFLNQYYSGTINDFQLVRRLFYFNKHRSLSLNDLAEKKLFNNKVFYEKIINRFNSEEKNAFIYEQLSWIGLEDSYAESSWINHVNPDKNITDFLKFLDDYCNIKLSGKPFENFAKRFKELANAAYGKQNGDRSDRQYGLTKMRKLFKAYNLNYIIEFKNEVYTLRKNI